MSRLATGPRWVMAPARMRSQSPVMGNAIYMCAWQITRGEHPRQAPLPNQLFIGCVSKGLALRRRLCVFTV